MLSKFLHNCSLVVLHLPLFIQPLLPMPNLLLPLLITFYLALTLPPCSNQVYLDELIHSSLFGYHLYRIRST